jgi:hypothetical protein
MDINKIIKSDYFFASIIAFFTTLIFFWGNIVGDAFFWEDIVEYVYPFQNFAATSDEIPFWNPYTFGGMPFFADVQTGFFYPLNRLLDLFVSDGKLPFAALQLVIILHYLISQLTTFTLAKSFGISKFGSMIAAIGYSFSMLMVSHTIHPMIIYQLAWLPLVLALINKSYLNSKIYLSILAGLVLGFSILAGHPQTILYEFIFIGLFSLAYLVKSFKDNDINKVKLVVSTLLTLLIAYGVFSVQLLPAQELAELSQRDAVNYEFSTEGSLHFKQALSTIVPNLFGKVTGEDLRNSTFYLSFNGKQGVYYYWETSYYFGVLVLALALFYLIKEFKTFNSILLGSIALFGFLFALGSNSFFYDILYNLPYIDTFRMPGRILFFTTLSMSILAGFGFDSLFKSDFKKDYSIYIAFGIPLLIGFLIVGGMFYGGFETPEQLISDVDSRALGSVLILVFGLIIGLLSIRKNINSMVAGSLFLIVIFIDLYSFGEDFNKSDFNPTETQIPRGYDMPDEFKKSFKPNLPDDIFRVNMRMYQPARYMAMKRNQGMVDKIMLTEGYNPLILKRVNPPMPNKDMNMDIRNVRYSIGIDNSINAPRFFENIDRFGNAWFVNKVQVVEEDRVAGIMESGQYNLKETVILEKEVEFSNKDQVPDYKIECTEYSNNKIVYKISNSTDGFLVLSEVYYPSWKAQVNGKDTEVLRANYCFRAINVSKGDNTVTLEYDSKTYKTGFTVSVLTLLLSLTGLLILWKKEI